MLRERGQRLDAMVHDLRIVAMGLEGVDHCIDAILLDNMWSVGGILSKRIECPKCVASNVGILVSPRTGVPALAGIPVLITVYGQLVRLCGPQQYMKNNKYMKHIDIWKKNQIGIRFPFFKEEENIETNKLIKFGGFEKYVFCYC